MRDTILLRSISLKEKLQRDADDDLHSPFTSNHQETFTMADNNQMQIDGDEAKGQQGEEYEEIREQVRCFFCARWIRCPLC